MALYLNVISDFQVFEFDFLFVLFDGEGLAYLRTTELTGLPRKLSTKTFADDAKVAVDRLLTMVLRTE